MATALKFNLNIDLVDAATGPFTVVLKRGATAPSDGTTLLTDTTDTLRNLHDAFELAFQYAGDYIATTNSTDDTFGN